jgi:hypothetical protein
MDDLKQLVQIDWWYVVIAVCLLLFCVKIIWTLLDWLLFEKLGIETRKMKQHKEESKLLRDTAELAKTTAENLDKLEKRRTDDGQNFRSSLNDYIVESRQDRKILHDEMIKFEQNRISDRNQSLEIQKKLTDSISARDERINVLITANKELLAEKINEKYKYYISIKGIPEDEYDEFVSLHSAYKDVGGNHNGDAKFQYCIKHLPVIPVESKLIYKDSDKVVI